MNTKSRNKKAPSRSIHATPKIRSNARWSAVQRPRRPAPAHGAASKLGEPAAA